MPSYQQYVINSRRAEAQSALMQFAQAMERHYAKKYSYKGLAVSDGDTGVPADIFPSRAPLEGATKYYNLTISAATENTYTLGAVPIAGTAQAGNGALTITSSSDTCWYKDQDSIPDDKSGCIRWKG
ncbi:type IV pilin protein [Spartinivicinus sp. A2-2]|uniref:Type IV pilin protein n=1 Tax=Spartinivicinus poritis TaxID=2994640 RepID=A0ABT5UDK7_9GAMM|nr:type IV pilin protein [Spartinivicinus sp. A2-2]